MADDTTASSASSASSPGASIPIDPAADGIERALLQSLWAGLGGDAALPGAVEFRTPGSLPSVFATTGLAAASVGAAGLALAELVAARHGALPLVAVDRRLASLWFGTTLRPQGWDLPGPWDAVAGDYRAADGWIRLHTNAPHHRAAALAVLQVPGEREQVARAVAGWKADALEAAVIAQGGCAGTMRDMAAWAAHPQGRAVMAEPLLHIAATDEGGSPAWMVPAERPLAGVRVLDLTRVLAGPVATRLLAGWGADVLRIDAPSWDEPGTVPEVTLGKRCARLDLRAADDRAVFERLLQQADVFVHGLRPDALERLGLGTARRQRLRPGLVDVRLDAYGWTGPWKDRRGFDSIVQMSTGIAEAGMRLLGRDRPTPLPVQALDHATGYLMAAAAVRGLRQRLLTGRGSETRAALARTAALLTGAGTQPVGPAFPPEHAEDQAPAIEATGWGPARRLLAPLAVQGAALQWAWPAGPLGSVRADTAWP